MAQLCGIPGLAPPLWGLGQSPNVPNAKRHEKAVRERSEP